MTRPLRVVGDRPERGVIYVRVSSLAGRDGERFHSPDQQAQAVRALFDARAIPIAETVEDIDVSGRTFTRAGLDRVLELARDGRITCVGLLDLSRLGRNTAESLRHIRELRDLGVRVVSTVEQIDDTPEGQFMLTQFLAMAQLYSDQIGRRWQSTLASVAAQGRWPGQAPIGYTKVDGQLVEDPELGPAVTDLFTGYATGRPISHLAVELSRARGMTTRLFVIRRILANPIYTGQVTWRGQTYAGRHPPLVDQATFDAVQGRRRQDSRTPARTLHPEHPLAGLIVCDACGTAAWAKPPNRRDKVRRYICGIQQEAIGCPGCGQPPIDDVVAAVLTVVERYGRLKGQRAHARLDGRRARAGASVARLRGEITRTETALGQLAADRALRQISETAYTAGAVRLERTLTSLRERLDVAERAAAAPAAAVVGEKVRELLEAWPLATDAERNTALRRVVAQVRIRRSVYYREPAADRVTVKLL